MAERVEPADELTDDEVLRRYLCIHFPHKASPAARAALHAPRIVEALARGDRAERQGDAVDALHQVRGQPGPGLAPGRVLHPHPRPLADRGLDRARRRHGRERLPVGAARLAPARLIYPERDQDDPRFDCAQRGLRLPLPDDDAVPVEVQAGTVLFFNGYLLHRSLREPGRHGYRRALVNHYMSAESLLPWHPPGPGEHMAIADYRDIVMVAGEDPYAWKGTVDSPPGIAPRQRRRLPPLIRRRGAGSSRGPGCGSARPTRFGPRPHCPCGNGRPSSCSTPPSGSGACDFSRKETLEIRWLDRAEDPAATVVLRRAVFGHVVLVEQRSWSRATSTTSPSGRTRSTLERDGATSRLTLEVHDSQEFLAVLQTLVTRGIDVNRAQVLS